MLYPNEAKAFYDFVNTTDTRQSNLVVLLTLAVPSAAVVDITEKSNRSRDAELTVEDLTAWQTKYGQFQYPTIVLVRTGYSRFWPSRRDYFGERNNQSANKSFPGEKSEVTCPAYDVGI